MLKRRSESTDAKKICEWIVANEAYSDATKRNYMSALIRMMQEGVIPPDPELWKGLNELRDKYNATQRARYAAGQCTPKQQAALDVITIDKIDRRLKFFPPK